MRHRCLPWLRITVLAALACLTAPAQNTTGTITGTVRDPSGALVAGARVTVRNEATGLTRTTESSDEGLYRVSLLPPGTYAVTVEKEGFKTQTQTGVRIEILQVRSVDFTLELGSVTDRVTVETRAPLLETETSQAGEVIKGEQVASLPLSARQFLQLTFLTPMAIPAINDFRSTEINRESAMPAAAGQRPEQNNYQVDGVDNRESGRNSLALSVSLDAISEFRVQTGLAPAEFGRGGGAIINVATKSGTNEFHGALYEYLRNNKFDARPFFANRVNPLKRNQFGGALGGPIARDKLLFFGNYEGFREAATGNPPVGRVPTDAERQGVLAVAIVDPLSNRVPFPNNTIPRSRFDRISTAVLDLVPRPNNPQDPLRNFVFNDVPSGRTDRDYVLGRLDYHLGTSDTLYGRYLFNEERHRRPPLLPPPANSGGQYLYLRAQSASLHWNRVLSPTLVNSLTLGFTRYRNRLATLNSFVKNLITPLGITNVMAETDPLFWAAPSVSVPGYLFPGEVTPNYRTMNQAQVLNGLLWSRGRHTVKFGGELRNIRTWMFYTGGNGSFTFANRYTNDTLADFLLGFASTVGKTARATQWNSRLDYGALYLQDDWKLTSRLTFNLGLRWEVESALRQSDNGGLGFDVRTGEMLVSRKATNIRAIQDFYARIRPDVKVRYVDEDRPYDADTNNLQPRIGFAYSLFSRTVVRGGYGLYFDAPQLPSAASSNDFAPNTLRPTWTADPRTPNLGWNPEGVTSAEEALRNAALTLFPFLSRKFPYGKIQQWTLGIQQQLSPTLVFEATYQGAGGVNLFVFDNINFRAPGPGNVQALLPYPMFARIQAFEVWGRSWFHGLGLKVEQRPTRGLSYLIAYSWSKSLDTASTLNQIPQWTDPFNRRTAKGPSDFHAPHRFSAAYEYRLPIGRNRALLSGVTGTADKLLSGWGVRGMTFFQTGLPQSPAMALSRTGICATACTARPDRVGNGNLPKSERTIQRFYDINAFRLLAPGGADRRVGNAGRNILVSAGVNNFDLQVFKDTRIREGHVLELRVEAFNAFNHTQWGPAGVNLEAPALFGVISSTRPPRIMQFALRYAF
ncbi:MAG: carboxypeptidase regulatory-like domain-containing protein [Bryobacterales bacterium]|nr:TonB-dependent receptor [Bryobacteraceae bacterium]MDW8355090.1 carboxypeptidase regulatory-like domain-containing protein [Bryobacterales bacterium]